MPSEVEDLSGYLLGHIHIYICSDSNPSVSLLGPVLVYVFVHVSIWQGT